MGRPNRIIKGIEDYFERNFIEIDEPMQIKLHLLGNLLNDYKECRKNVRENGIMMSFNANKTQGLNPAYKAKNDTIKLIIRLLADIIPKAKENADDEDDEDAEAFIYRLTHENLEELNNNNKT